MKKSLIYLYGSLENKMKNKDGLSPIINILDCEDIDSIIDVTYIEFKKII